MKKKNFLRVFYPVISFFLFNTPADLYALCGEPATGGEGRTVNTELPSKRDSGEDMDRASEVALEALKERQKIDWIKASFLGVIKNTTTEEGFEKAIHSLKDVKEATYNKNCPVLLFLESKKTYTKGNSGKIKLTEAAKESQEIDKKVFESSFPVKLASRFFLCLRIDITNIDLDSEKEAITESKAPMVVVMNGKGEIKGLFIGKKCTEDKIYKCMSGITKEDKINMRKIVGALDKYNKSTMMAIERKLYYARRKAHHISDHLLEYKERKYKKGYESSKKKLKAALAVCKELEEKRYEYLLYEYSVLRKAGALVDKPIP